jgi:hypothetical protein
MTRAGQAAAEPSASSSAIDSGAPNREALVEELARRSDEAAESAGGFRDRFFDLAGLPIQLRFAGSALEERMCFPLAHVEIDPPPSPALTVTLWDSDSTSSTPPKPLWGLDAYRRHGVIKDHFDEDLYAVFQRGSQSLLVLDVLRDRGFFWTGSAERLHMLDHGSPLRTLLHLWLDRQGVQLVHSAAVGRTDGCVLLAGNAGSGKSSTALACLPSSLGHLGEDYCMVTPGDPPIVSSLYSSGKADKLARARMPWLEPLVVGMPSPETPKMPKALLDLYTTVPEKLIRRAELRAIALPAVTGEPGTQVEPCTRPEAMAGLAPSTMLQLPGTSETTMKRLSSLVRAVPTYRLRVGTDPAGIPPAIEHILEIA